ncbi:Echinoderm microtubule-associated protein-like 5, partial [Cladochytrium tenue]
MAPARTTAVASRPSKERRRWPDEAEATGSEARLGHGQQKKGGSGRSSGDGGSSRKTRRDNRDNDGDDNANDDGGETFAAPAEERRPPRERHPATTGPSRRAAGDSGNSDGDINGDGEVYSGNKKAPARKRIAEGPLASASSRRSQPQSPVARGGTKAAASHAKGSSSRKKARKPDVSDDEEHDYTERVTQSRNGADMTNSGDSDGGHGFFHGLFHRFARHDDDGAHSASFHAKAPASQRQDFDSHDSAKHDDNRRSRPAQRKPAQKDVFDRKAGTSVGDNGDDSGDDENDQRGKDEGGSSRRDHQPSRRSPASAGAHAKSTATGHDPLDKPSKPAKKSGGGGAVAAVRAPLLLQIIQSGLDGRTSSATTVLAVKLDAVEIRSTVAGADSSSDGPAAAATLRAHHAKLSDVLAPVGDTYGEQLERVLIGVRAFRCLLRASPESRPEDIGSVADILDADLPSVRLQVYPTFASDGAFAGIVYLAKPPNAKRQDKSQKEKPAKEKRVVEPEKQRQAHKPRWAIPGPISRLEDEHRRLLKGAERDEQGTSRKGISKNKSSAGKMPQQHSSDGRSHSKVMEVIGHAFGRGKGSKRHDDEETELGATDDDTDAATRSVVTTATSSSKSGKQARKNGRASDSGFHLSNAARRGRTRRHEDLIAGYADTDDERRNNGFAVASRESLDDLRPIGGHRGPQPRRLHRDTDADDDDEISDGDFGEDDDVDGRSRPERDLHGGEDAEYEDAAEFLSEGTDDDDDSGGGSGEDDEEDTDDEDDDEPKTRDLNAKASYRMREVNNNAFYLAPGVAVFPAGSVGVVMDLQSNTQRFFQGRHLEDVTAIAVHPSRRLVATGDLVSHSAGAFVYVWDPRAPEDAHRQVLIRVGDKKLARGVADLEFSPDGRFLVAVAMDDEHSVFFYDWQKAGKLIAKEKGHNDSIFGITFNPTAAYEFVTYGVKHLKHWTFDLSSGKLKGTRGQFGSARRAASIICCAYLPNGSFVTGTAAGDLLFWKGAQVINAVESVHKGAIFSVLYNRDLGIVTGGKDGSVATHDARTMETVSRVQLEAGVRSLDLGSDGAMLIGLEDSILLELVSFGTNEQEVRRVLE